MGHVEIQDLTAATLAATVQAEFGVSGLQIFVFFIYTHHWSGEKPKMMYFTNMRTLWKPKLELSEAPYSALLTV